MKNVPIAKLNPMLGLGYVQKDARAAHNDIITIIRDFEASLPDNQYVTASFEGQEILIKQIYYTKTDLIVLDGHQIPSQSPARILCHLHELRLVLRGREMQDKESYSHNRIGFAPFPEESA